jgi:L-asparaginase
MIVRMSDREHRRVEVFAMGGTIAMTAAATGGAAVALTAEQLTTGLPGLADSAISVGVRDFRRKPGASVTVADIVELAQAIPAALAEGAHGIVVTQGTDTIEETSFLLDLYHPSHQPVVVTGAMRNPSLAGADGPANLLGAIVTAAHPATTGQGVLVVFADEIHAARRVRKTHSMNVDTFKSPNGGPIGYVVEGVPIVHNHLSHRLTIPLSTTTTAALARVGIVTIALGDEGELLDGIENRLDALVIAAMGVGHVPDRLVARLEDLASVMPVVLASRTAAGPVLRKTYGFAGSELDLNRRGLIPAGYLDPYKVRVLLIAALAAQANRAQIAAAVAVAGGYAGPGHWPFTPMRG